MANISPADESYLRNFVNDLGIQDSGQSRSLGDNEKEEDSQNAPVTQTE